MWRSLPLAACSRLYSRDLAWLGVFAKNAMLSVQFASVIVSAGYHVLPAFLQCKAIFFHLMYMCIYIYV